jgi:hypothetical protein
VQHTTAIRIAQYQYGRIVPHHLVVEQLSVVGRIGQQRTLVVDLQVELAQPKVEE